MAVGGNEQTVDLSDMLDSSRMTSYRLTGEINKLEAELERFKTSYSKHSTPIRKADNVDSGIYSKRMSSKDGGYSDAAGIAFDHGRVKPKVRFPEGLSEESWPVIMSDRQLGSGNKETVLDPGVTIRRQKGKSSGAGILQIEKPLDEKSRLTTPITVTPVVSKPYESIAKKEDQPENDSGVGKMLTLKPTSDSRPLNAIKPATYDGTGSWIDYISHFRACATINNWSDTQKGLYLAVSLRGHAQGVLGNLTGDENQHDYKRLVHALEERFAPKNQAELYRVQLKERRQKASETLPVLGQDIRRLTNLAYPTAPSDVREMLAMGQFIDALHDSDMRIRVKQARPTSLNDALKHAVELEAFKRAENKHQENSGHLRATSTVDALGTSDLHVLQEQIKVLQKELKFLRDNTSSGKTGKDETKATTQRSRYVPQRTNRRECYYCHKTGHIKKDCLALKRKQQEAQEKGESSPEGVKGASKTLISKDKRYRKATIGISQPEDEPGLYVKVSIEGVQAKLLIDSGATVTVISKNLYEQVGGESVFPLEKMTQTVVAAGGSLLKIYGKTTITINMESHHMTHLVVVAELNVDGIFGLDIMKANKCLINTWQDRLIIGGKEIPLFTEGKVGCYRIKIGETVTVAPRTEVIIPGKAEWPDNWRTGECGIIESNEKFLKSGKALVGRTLVQKSEVTPVRLLNPSSTSQTIYAGTTIAEVKPINKIVGPPVQEEKSPNDVPPHIKDLIEQSTQDLTKEQTERVKDLLIRHSDLFAKTDNDVGRTGIVKHRIRTGDVRPIKQPARRMPVHMGKEIDKHVEEMLAKDVIEPSVSPWSSPVVLVEKKEGSTRFCVDYRQLNAVTIKDAYPLPRIDDSLDYLQGVSWFSTLDLCSGYWQVEMVAEDREKTAFNCRTGLFQFKVMPFGLCNAPATFERLMDTVLAGLQWDICLIYLDDIIVTGKTFEDMLTNLEKVFKKLQEAGLTLKAKKCTLFAKRVHFLGHVVTEEGVATDPSKVEVVQTWPIPTNVTELRSFLGFCSYYRRFIANFAKIAKPLHRLTELGRCFVWTEDHRKSFDTLRQKLMQAPILAHPDFSKSFILDTDASNDAIGAVLSQIQGGEERPIAYASRSLTKAERRYCVTRKELLAVVHFVKYFRHYLYGKRFLVRTDHGSLRWLTNFKNPEGQLARWFEVLASYNMEIEHRPGRQHKNADSLSRIPCKQCGREEPCIQQYPIREKSKGSVVANTLKVQEESPMKLLELQEQDHCLQLVKSWIENNKKPLFNEIKSEGFFVKSLWNQWERLTIDDGLLCRKWSRTEKPEEQVQIIVPFAERRTVLTAYHDAKTAGHLGINKTLSRIRQRYYWPGLQADVRRYVAGCEKCMKGKSPGRNKRAPMQITRAGIPMERIATDILGELPETDSGNRYILVVSDYFTKWTEAFAMPNMETPTIAKIIVEEVITRFGVPKILHSDQGRQFESRLFQEVCKLLGIQKTRTTPYHPKSDGMVERFNKTLASMLRAFSDENQTDWDEQLPYVMMAYRSAENETTGCSPNMLMLGRETTTPLDVIYEIPSGLKPVPTSQWAWVLQERLEAAHSYVRKHTERAILRQKGYHDRKTSWETFDKGSKVLVLFPVRKPGRSAKLSYYWRGPFKVKQKMSNVLYSIDCGKNDTTQIVHCDRIRRWREQSLRGEGEDYRSAGEFVVDIEGTQADDEQENMVEQTDPPEDRNDATDSDTSNNQPKSRKMPNTKKTPRQKGRKCPFCEEWYSSEKEWERHIVECAKQTQECEHCDFVTTKKANLIRHVKRMHKTVEKNEESPHGSRDIPKAGARSISVVSAKEDSDSDWEKQDPGELLEDNDSSESENVESDSETKEEEKQVVEVSDVENDTKEDTNSYRTEKQEGPAYGELLLGRVVRKPTEPTKVFAPKRKDRKLVELPPIKKDRGSVLLKDQEAQTSGKSGRRLWRKTTTCSIGDKKVEEVEEEEIYW